MTTDQADPNFPLQKEWKVLSVREGKKEPNRKGAGELQKFYVNFEGAPDVYWRRKLPATIDVGGTYFGTVSQSDYGLIFKKESPGDFRGNGNGGGSAGGGQSFRPASGADPERAARTDRFHAQRLAVEVLAARDGLNGDEETVKASISRWTDWAAANLDPAGERTGVGG